jgi:hypothetical protein
MNVLFRNSLSCLTVLFAVIILGNVYAEASEAVTNGIYVSAKVVDDRSMHEPYRILMTIRFTPPNTNVDASVFQRGPGPRAIFFRSTNSFPGYVSLRDMAGNEIPLLKPQVNATNAYPATYDLREVSRLLMNLIGTGPPLPYVIGGGTADLSFLLTDYFRPEKLGKYELTVWPMIYKRTNADSFVCHRIDLPAVTVSIDYTNISSNWEHR